MKKMIMIAAFGLAMVSCAAQEPNVTISLPIGDAQKQLIVSHALIDNMVKARKESDLNVTYDTIPVENGKAHFRLDPAGPSRYSVNLGEGSVADFYAAPADTILLDVKSVNPLNYTVTGTALMTDMSELAAITNPIEDEYRRIAASGVVTEEQVRPIMDAYDKAIKDFIAAKPNSPAVPFAILDMSGTDFLEAYKNLTPEARKSIMMPFANAMLPRVEKQVEAELKRERMLSGEMPAPGFRLPDLNGKMVSLEEFRGKWVLLDFWGSWCGWCIKGFPKLKEAYKEYAGKLEVIGIDCNETEEAWKAGVKKYELSWVNLYNNQTDGALLGAYGITGFPTKAIINPEGKLVDLTVGEDPTFYERLANFMK